MQSDELARQDLYAILEVSADASAEEIRRSYFRLAMRYHPDVHDGRDKESVDRFIAIQRAYKLLTDAARREAYDRIRRRGHAASTERAATPEAEEWSASPRRPTADQERDARRAFLHAEELVLQGDGKRAVEVMRAVIRAVPDVPAYQSLYGYALALAGQRLHAARDLCRRAVEAEPFNADFHAHLGCVYQKAGLRKTAQECFREALRWDPKHPLATQHVAPDKSAGGGMGWLRGLVRRQA